MATLIYAPQARIHIATENHGIVDVSADISGGRVTRVTQGISTMQATLLNQSRKYDGIFNPMDRVVVYLKRLKWMLVFSGYLDESPMMSTLPGSINITGSCTLKILQNFLWDPGADASRVLIERALTFGDNRALAQDGGFAGAAITLLEAVADWPRSKVHIANIPTGWMDKIATFQQERIAEADAITAANEAYSGATIGAFVSAQGVIAGENPIAGKPTSVPGIGKGTGTLPATSGKCSTFGGPRGGAYGNFALTGEDGEFPKDGWFCAMRWPYVTENLQAIPGVNVSKAKQWWANQRIVVLNPKTNKAVVVRAADWGPNIRTGRVIDLSRQALDALGAATDDVLHIAFADNGTKTANLGPIKVVGVGPGASSLTGSPGAVNGGWGEHGDTKNMVQVTIPGTGLKFTCHKLAAEKFRGFVLDLINVFGYHPKVIQGFVDKEIRDTGKISNHAWGAAIDIDPTINKRYGTAAGGPYALPHDVQKLVSYARKWGLFWGGEYNQSKDYMHFEVIGAPSTQDPSTSSINKNASPAGGNSYASKWSVPVPAPFTITARFGQTGKQWASGKHTGLDFDVNEGTPIHPVGPGIVHSPDGSSAYGNNVIIDHGKGVYTVYAHMRDTPLVTIGQTVTAQTTLGYVGATGNVTGAHLHVELRLDGASQDDAVDPEPYLLGSRKNPPRGLPGSGQDPTGTGSGDSGSYGAVDPSNTLGMVNAITNLGDFVNTQKFSDPLFAGYRAIANDEPIFQTISQYLQTAMREFCSAPNGDLIAWFPDYFGEWKQAGKLVVKALEIDIESGPPTIYRSDRNLKTHWFVSSSTTWANQDAQSVEQLAVSAGLASVEFPEIMRAFLNISAADAAEMKDYYLKKFGARVEWKPMNSISNNRLAEFFFATRLFMKNWSEQFRTTINLTFMPEAFPGMLMVLEDFGLQGYINQVEHTWDYTGGFRTSINAAPWSTLGTKGPPGFPKGAPL